MVRFEDFHLIVNGADGRYTVEARGAGEVSTPQVPLLYEETPEVTAGLLRLQEGAALTRQEMEGLGTHLYHALFPPAVARAYSSAREALSEGGALRLKLNLRPPELARLPWELLFDPHHRAFLAGRRSQPLVRTVDSAGPVASLRLSVPPRILQLEAQPSDRAMLDELERSRTALVAAWGRQVDVVTMAAATPGKLRLRLAEKPGFHILHYDGHATFEEATESGYLILEDAEGSSHPLAGSELADYLDDTPVRLVVLAACLTGRDALERRFQGIAQHLMHTSSLPAVVAMQYPVSDAGARAFIEGFYGALASGEPLEVAVTAGRLAIREEAGPEAVSEWAAPVLFMRTSEGDLFAPEPMEGDAVPWPAPEITALPEPAAEGEEPMVVSPGNPFTPGSVVPPERFVGRKKELEAILGRLGGETLMSVSLVGEVRMGKTSLLHYLEAYLPTLLGGRGRYLPIYLSMDEQSSQASFSRAILEKLLPQVVPPKGKEQALRALEQRVAQGQAISFDEAKKVIEWGKASGLRVVLLLDEFKHLLEKPDEFDDTFRNTLRSLYTHSTLAVVLATRQPLTQIPGLNAYIANGLTTTELSLLLPSEAEDLLRQPHDRPFSEEEIKLGLEVAQRHPLRLQSTGYWLYQWKKQWDSPIYIGPDLLHPNAYNILHKQVEQEYDTMMEASKEPLLRIPAHHRWLHDVRQSPYALIILIVLVLVLLFALNFALSGRF